jgi:hypothetical protein
VRSRLIVNRMWWRSDAAEARGMGGALSPPTRFLRHQLGREAPFWRVAVDGCGQFPG